MDHSLAERIPLRIEPLPDGVRYLFPRRPRTGWGQPLKDAVVSFLVYFLFSLVSVGCLVSGRSSAWLFLGATAILLAVLTHGVGALRTVYDVLSIPDVEIEVRTGRLVVVHRILGWSTSRVVPLADIRRLTIISLLDTAEAQAIRQPAAPLPPGVATGFRRMFRVWFPNPEAEELARAERRKVELLRSFGELSIEADDEARMAVADGYSQAYLLALARDLAARIEEVQPVAVVQSGPAPEPIPPDDPQLVRPADLTDIRAGPTIKGFTLEVPPAFPPGAMLVAMLVGAGVAFVFANIFLRVADVKNPFLWSPDWIELPYLGFFAAAAGMGLYASFRLVQSLWRSRLRTFFHIKDGVLSVERASPLGTCRQEWKRSEIAALTTKQRSIIGRDGKQKWVYDLLLLDHAIRPTILLRERLEAEILWLVAVLHEKLAIGM